MHICKCCIHVLHACIHIPVKDYLVHVPVLKLGGGVLLGTSASALLANPSVVLEFVLLGVRGRVLLLKESPNDGKLGYTHTIQ